MKLVKDNQMKLIRKIGEWDLGCEVLALKIYRPSKLGTGILLCCNHLSMVSARSFHSLTSLVSLVTLSCRLSICNIFLLRLRRAERVFFRRL